MAKIRGGALVGQVSGSVGSNTFAHNRYGAYVRNRVVPVKSVTSYAMQAKAWLGQASQGWQALTDAQKGAWRSWAETNPITDTLGDKQVLTGHAAYVQINRRRLQDAAALLSVPPQAAAPVPLATLSLTADIGAGNFEIAYTATPAPAGTKLWVWAAVVDSPGISYVKNLLKLVQISAAAQASPLDIEAAVTARFGSMAVGQKVVVEAATYTVATGLLSGRLRAEAIVVST